MRMRQDGYWVGILAFGHGDIYTIAVPLNEKYPSCSSLLLEVHVS
jgi:hypothetical protein